jgi:gliding motility-associated-like protein
MKCIVTITLLAVLLTGKNVLYAQTFTPVTVTGFNSDIVAEAGLNAVAGTSTVIDGSNHVIHTTGFAAANGITGGIINTGTIVSGTRTYQMAPFTGLNALYMSSAGNVPNTAGTGTLTLATPKAYSNLSLLAFGTENNSVVTVILNFTDGTTVNAGNITIKDWFDGTPFLIRGFGRLTRLAGTPYGVDGGTLNPRMYAFDFLVPCASQSKLVQSITFNYIPGPNPSSRALIMAVSGVGYTPLTYSQVVTNPICGGPNGNIAITAAGGTSPLTYSWNTNPTQTNATATNLAGGFYACAIKDANNCITSVFDTLVPKSLASIIAVANPAEICSGATSALSATATGGTVSGYSWNPGTISGDNATVTPATTSQYVVTAKDAFGCIVADTVAVTVKPTPSAAFILRQPAVCLGFPDTLVYTGGAADTATYTWDGGGAPVQGGGVGGDPNSYLVKYTAAGTYTASLQVTENGCVSPVVTHQITVQAPPVVSFSVNKNPICTGDIVTVTFTGTASDTAVTQWNWGGGTLQSGTGLHVKYQTSGTISLTVTDGACIRGATPVAIDVITKPTAKFTPDIITGCTPVTVNFNNQSTFANSYKWLLGDGGTATSEDVSHTYGSPGTYTVTLIAGSQNLCFDTLVKTGLISVLAPPVASFTAQPGENTPIEYKNATFNFTNTSQNATQYQWEFGDGITSSLINPVYKWELPGDYRVTLYVTNEIGCTDSTSRAWYKIIPDLVLEIPNAFSPNGDGINDRWNIDGLKARPACQIEVYNRWGQTVYKSVGYTIGWNGLRQGKPVSEGTYYYVIKTAPGEKPYTGWVVLLR